MFFTDNKLIKFSDLKDLIAVIVSAPAVAFYVFLLKCFVDQDNDGIPDQLEEDNEEENNRIPPPPHKKIL